VACPGTLKEADLQMRAFMNDAGLRGKADLQPRQARL
jgi:hypothetical protein